MPSNFLEALAKAFRPIIMEIKPRDGHGRDLLRGRTLGETARLYEAAGAPCLSVVTGHWFGGGSVMLKEVAGQTGPPLRCKDFFTRADQIARARQAGAYAILLTAGILPKPLLRHLIEVCFREDVTFVEIAEASDLDGLKLAGCAVAVNNKDIAKRERDPAALERSVALLPAVQGSGAACTVSASGISTPEIAVRLPSLPRTSNGKIDRRQISRNSMNGETQ
jgi:indole-3-glycerol phosphate synthase